jgi:hypothetical protein
LGAELGEALAAVFADAFADGLVDGVDAGGVDAGISDAAAAELAACGAGVLAAVLEMLELTGFIKVFHQKKLNRNKIPMRAKAHTETLHPVFDD